MLHTIKGGLSAYDIKILSFFNHNRITALDSFFVILSFATTFVSISLILTLLTISIIRKSKSIRYKGYVLISAFLLSALTSFILKNIIYRERPFVTYPFIEKLSEGGNSSFPSGHTLEAFTMATTIAFLISNRIITTVVFLWAFLVAYSRMLLGVHYPSDVLTGMLIGSFIGWAVSRFAKKHYGLYE